MAEQQIHPSFMDIQFKIVVNQKVRLWRKKIKNKKINKIDCVSKNFIIVKSKRIK